MAFLGMEYSTADLPESDGFDPVPAGWYNADITGAEVKTTKAGTGQFIKLELTITGPSFQGRKIWANINISNPNKTAEEIGLKQLGDITRAIGLAKISDSDQLIGGSLAIKVAVTPETPGYPAGNDVKGFKAIEGSAPPAMAAKPAAAAPAGNGSKAPWQK